MKHDDIYTRITLQIIDAITSGETICRMPWHNTDVGLSAPLNAVSKRPYRGINVLALWAAASRRGYTSGVWATYQQWKQLGAQVRKGEKATEIVLWKTGENRSEDDDEEKSGRFLLARGYSVFNSSQVDGYTPKASPELAESERLVGPDEFFWRLGADIAHFGNEAFYDTDDDVIYIPPFKQFRSAAAYYSTLAHEAMHWTGAAHRLNRNLGSRFGSLAYAAEELIAELGAAFLGAFLNTGSTAREDHAGYIASWLSLLRNDKRAIFTAASQAQKAVDWICAQVVQRDAAA